MAFLGKVKVNDTLLTPTEKSVYLFLSENFEAVSHMHVRDIAKEAHAGTSSVVRLIHKLGYSSYGSFQKFTQQQLDKKRVETSVFKRLSVDSFPPDLIEKCTRLKERLLSSENVVFFGLGASGSICQYGARRLAVLGLAVSAVTDVTYPIEAGLTAKTHNLLIVYSISGKTNKILETLSTLSSGKMDHPFTITSVTPDASSPLALLSDISINYSVERQQTRLSKDLTSQIPALFITELLSEMVSQEMKILKI